MLTITTYDWVPEAPRGWVRELRPAWACAEAGLPFRFDTLPLRPKSPAHLARQPFGQVPILRDGDIELWESGACVLHIAERSEALMPKDATGRAEVLSWIFAALNSVEPLELFRQYVHVFDPVPAAQPSAIKALQARLAMLEDAWDGRAFAAAGRFTAADILLADVLRASAAAGQLDGHPQLADYVARLTARPAFRKVHDEQVARFQAADARLAAR